jgi:hypothetical protein
MSAYVMTEQIHRSRTELVYSPYTADNLECVPLKGQEHIGHFEWRYGKPTDVDAVWRDREAYQNSLYQQTVSK